MAQDSRQANTEVVTRAFQAWDEGDVDVFDEVYADDVVHPNLDIEGLDELKSVIPVWFEAFPDLSHTVHATIAEGDWVCTRFEISGTHEGSFQGVEPTGETFELLGIAMERVENGQIVERWVVEDQFDLFQQLGVVESPA